MSNLFEFLPEDVEYLDANHRDHWHKLNEGSAKYGLLIEGFAIPARYVQSKADFMILVPAGYPASALDMFYFDPPLTLLNGEVSGSLAIEEHFARQWQRWSRHYQWTAGEDDLVRHIEYVWHELQKAASR